jgi:hypothetical protein
MGQAFKSQWLLYPFTLLYSGNDAAVCALQWEMLVRVSISFIPFDFNGSKCCSFQRRLPSASGLESMRRIPTGNHVNNHDVCFAARAMSVTIVSIGNSAFGVVVEVIECEMNHALLYPFQEFFPSSMREVPVM